MNGESTEPWHQIWIGSLHTCRISGHRLNMTAEAADFGSYDQAHEEAFGVGSVIDCATVSVQRWTPTLHLPQNSQSQLRFRHHIIGRELLADEILIVQPTFITALPHRVPLQQHSNRKLSRKLGKRSDQ